MPKSKSSIAQRTPDVWDEHLAEFIEARKINDLGRMRFNNNLGRLRSCLGLTKSEFLRELYDVLRERCDMDSDFEVATAFEFSPAMQPADLDGGAFVEAQAKREQAERLAAEADAQEQAATAKNEYLVSLHEKRPFMVEQLDYYENVLPGHLQDAINSAKNAISQNGYSLREHRGFGHVDEYLITMNGRILSAERALSEHPKNVAVLRKQLDDFDAEIETLSTPRKKKK